MMKMNVRQGIKSAITFLAISSCVVNAFIGPTYPEKIVSTTRHTTSIIDNDVIVNKVTNFPIERSSSTSADATTFVPPHELSPLELWCSSHLDVLYAKSQTSKCPFWRRRFGDMLDTIDNVMRSLLIRKECLPLLGPLQRCKHVGPPKQTGLSMEQLYDIIQRDWNTRKGYYVTGKLTSSIYRNDCLFDGPDPDMPVHGLRKYLGVAALLFDQSKSYSELLSLTILNNHQILARWKMSATIKLPWRPQLPEWTGTTFYNFDKDNLIYRHQETWDLSVQRAFLYMVNL